MRIPAIILALTALLSSLNVHAQTVFSASDTVTTADRTATFTGISGDLTNYTEDSLIVSAPGNHCCFTDVHYENGGNDTYVTITGSDDAVFSAMDFVLGNGQGGTLTNVRWEAYLDGGLVGSGLVSDVTKGIVVGWTNPTGFDELRVAALSTDPNPGFGNQQSISLDDLRAQVGVTAVATPTAVPALGGMGLIILSGMIGLLGVLFQRRR